MSSILETLSQDHRRCDEVFVAAENACAEGDWGLAGSQGQAFFQAMEHHFRIEEQVLFPAFEAVTGMTMGPTEVMRGEHAQMRELFREMGEALEAQDADSYLGLSETLLMIMQQHNAKEEQMLYQMADQVLAGQVDDLLRQMADLDG